jgi:hypothetical protein
MRAEFVFMHLITAGSILSLSPNKVAFVQIKARHRQRLSLPLIPKHAGKREMRLFSLKKILQKK